MVPWIRFSLFSKVKSSPNPSLPVFPRGRHVTRDVRTALPKGLGRLVGAGRPQTGELNRPNRPRLPPRPRRGIPLGPYLGEQAEAADAADDAVHLGEPRARAGRLRAESLLQGRGLPRAFTHAPDTCLPTAHLMFLCLSHISACGLRLFLITHPRP